jgi:hypothetical protein
MGKWFSNPDFSDRFTSIWNTTPSTINLRDEFNKLVLGHGSTPGLGIYMMHRILDRGKVRCACWDQNRGSSSHCKFCKGESYSWSEVWVRGYFTQTYGRSLTAATQVNELRQAGQFDHDKAIMYLPADSTPETGDAMFRIRLDMNGKPYYPVERVEKWRCVNVEDRRQENGEVAFWLILCERVEF